MEEGRRGLDDYPSLDLIQAEELRILIINLGPSAPPQGLVTKILNSTAASLRWSPPPQNHANGVLTGYRVSESYELSSKTQFIILTKSYPF